MRCGRGATLGAQRNSVGTKELTIARWATALGAVAFLAAATTPKLVDSSLLFWIATLMASAQRMAIPCIRSIFSVCANNALQGQALGAVAALEVAVRVVASPAYISIFHATTALDAPLTPPAPSGSDGADASPWIRFTTFLSGALVGPSSVVCVYPLPSCFVASPSLRPRAWASLAVRVAYPPSPLLLPAPLPACPVSSFAPSPRVSTATSARCSPPQVS